MSNNWLETDQAWVNGRLATIAPHVPTPYGELSNHALVVRGERILSVLPQAQLESFPGAVHDTRQRWITPGLVDCHTHLIYAGNAGAQSARCASPAFRTPGLPRRAGEY